MTSNPQRRLRSGKEFSPFDLALGLAIKPPVEFDVEDYISRRWDEMCATNDFDEVADIVIPGLEELQLHSLETSVKPIVPSNPHTTPLQSDDLSAQERRKLKSKAKRFDKRHTQPSAPVPSKSADKALAAVERDKVKGKRKRDLRRLDAQLDAQDPRRKQMHNKRAQAACSAAIRVDHDVAELPHTKPGWTGCRKIDTSTSDDLRIPDIGETGLGGITLTQEEVNHLVGRDGFVYIRWLGLLTLPIFDSKKRLIALLGGQPRDTLSWKAVTDGAARLMEEAATRLDFTDDDCKHRRALEGFIAVSRGPSFGSGQEQPGCLRNNAVNTQITDELMAHTYFQRIVGFTSLLFYIYATRLYTHYEETKAALLSWKRLRWNFVNTVFAACTFNFLRAVTRLHIDFGNLVWGWCSITALGDFDPDKGGHLILWDLKLIIRFPPGSTIFIPSALLRHSNTSIGKNETRHSFTQYTAGGIFRWVANGFKTDEQFLRTATPEQRAEREAKMKGRWEFGLGHFSTLEELQQSAAN